jgi:diketogulonate reductase-like aldo/keto reductase
MQSRAIPSSGEMLPVIGCGTWQGFDRAPGTTEYERLAGVLTALFDAGGRVIDSSPMYGKAEAAVGRLLAARGAGPRPFLATKVWTTGRSAGVRQMEQSLRLLGAAPLDLLQVHNLVDWRTHLPTLQEWKQAGRVRYLGITHYTNTAYAELEAVLRSEAWDFLQVNYSLDETAAAHRLLPLAQERGVAVLVNLPFGGGRMLRSLRARSLPSWAAEIGCTTWPQVLLKFVLAHPAVTCAIPGTGNPQHMEQNAQAGIGTIPDLAYWNDKLPLFGP